MLLHITFTSNESDWRRGCGVNVDMINLQQFARTASVAVSANMCVSCVLPLACLYSLVFFVSLIQMRQCPNCAACKASVFPHQLYLRSHLCILLRSFFSSCTYRVQLIFIEGISRNVKGKSLRRESDQTTTNVK